MYNLKLIRLQALIQIVTIIIIIVSLALCICWGFSVLVYISISFFLVESIFQMYFILSSKGEIFFNTNGVEIKNKKLHKFVNWNAVKGIYYNSFAEIFPFLNHCTLELWIESDGKTVLVDEEIGDIKCTKKRYRQIVSLIPYDLIEENDFLLYRNIVEKQKKARKG
ncbi:MAG: hypothetical protein K2J85_02985 [Anaeroplasmataceae bacterium]|nr:hypothetical protein [Anaeroplasmataceae bacterium]